MHGITGDEGVIERSGLLPEISERVGQRQVDGLGAGRLADQVPLDSGFQRGFG